MLTRAAAGLMLSAAVVMLAPPSDPTWRQPVEPLRIAGNIYYVGTRGLSSFLIVTPAGAILIDTGEAESVPFIRANIEHLGVHLSDVRILLAGHAHYDHVGGHAEMKRLTGATVVAMEADREAIASGVDRSPLGGPGWTPVPVGRVVKDGDAVSLGGVAITAHLTPGHTQGCTTWTTEVVQEGKRYRVAFVCSVTVNDGVHLVGNTRVPDIASQYAQAFRVLHSLHPDVFVAEHPVVFSLEAKAAELAAMADPLGSNPFVDRDGYARFVESAEQAYLSQLRQEQR
jgi:metallo-beta-lactamase class B